MKRFICVLLCALMLFGLVPMGHGHAEEGMFVFTRENFPVMDGSTSMVPLGKGIASVLLGESREDAGDVISFHRTTQSFRNLQEGQCDIVIAAEPKSEVFDEMAENGFAYEIETIAKEALVFVVNESNPVNSLTREQVKGIYAGTITNWSEVGGEDLPIEAFQRNPTAGSQVMMEKLVMEGTPMMEAPIGHIPTEMGELIEAVKSYDNSANAIGYTVYYYAADMQMAQGLKILKIDDVLPSVQSLQEEAYPYINGYYCCIGAQEPSDSPARVLYNWLASQAGQELLALEGYVPAYVNAEDTGAGVHTDYSAYTPNGGTPAKFTPIEGDLNAFQPGDYGLLYPYQGSRIYVSYADDMEDYFFSCAYGLFTRDGKLVTNPIYNALYRLSFREWIGRDYVWLCSVDGEHYGFIAKDGSFASEMKYGNMFTIGDYILGLVDYETWEFDLFTKDGTLLYTQEDFQYEGRTVLPYDCVGDHFFCDIGSDDMYYCVLMDAKGNVVCVSDSYIYPFGESAYMTYKMPEYTCTVYDFDGTPIPFDDALELGSVNGINDQFYVVFHTDNREVLTDRNGNLFEWDFIDYRSNMDGTFLVYKEDATRLYDSKGKVLWEGRVNYSWDYLGSGGIFLETLDDGGVILHNVMTGDSLELPWAYSVTPCGKNIFIVWGETPSMVLIDSNLQIIDRTVTELRECVDEFTGEYYLIDFDPYGFSGSQQLLTAEAKDVLFRADGDLRVMDGMIFSASDWAFRAYEENGELLFCYPYYGMASGD